VKSTRKEHISRRNSGEKPEEEKGERVIVPLLPPLIYTPVRRISDTLSRCFAANLGFFIKSKFN
jgi:hypothetical protein